MLTMTSQMLKDVEILKSKVRIANRKAAMKKKSATKTSSGANSETKKILAITTTKEATYGKKLCKLG